MDISDNLQSLLSICKQSRIFNSASIVSFFFSLRPSISDPFRVYTSVAMTHSLLSSAITNTDWYMESLEEHIVDILHSGFSLYILLRGIFSSKHFS